MSRYIVRFPYDPTGYMVDAADVEPIGGIQGRIAWVTATVGTTNKVVTVNLRYAYYLEKERV